MRRLVAAWTWIMVLTICTMSNVSGDDNLGATVQEQVKASGDPGSNVNPSSQAVMGDDMAMPQPEGVVGDDMSFPQPEGNLGDDVLQSPFQIADDALSCFSDDDDVYNQDSCMSIDATACSTFCYQSFYCTDACGYGTDTCEDGGGAVCAMYKLSHIQEVCATKTDTPPSNWTTATIDLDTTDTTNISWVGCDDHAYCSFCKDEDWCYYVLNELAPQFVDDYVELRSLGYGPLAMTILGSLDSVCEMLDGMDDVTVVRTTNDDEIATYQPTHRPTSQPEDVTEASQPIDQNDDPASPDSNALGWAMKSFEVALGCAFFILVAYAIIRRRKYHTHDYTALISEKDDQFS